MAQPKWQTNMWNGRAASTAAALTNTSLKAAPGAGRAHYITDIHISNEGTANTVQLLDGSGGTVIWGSYFAVNGGENAHLDVPIKLTANTALCVTTSAADHCYIMVEGFTGRA